jgi:hypothetical protein
MMEVNVNTVVLAARVYAALRERFFIADACGDSADADGGEVIATIRGAIVDYIDETFGASLQ